MVSRNWRGVWPKRCKMLKAMRVLSPDFIRQAARMNAPRMKKTASLPKSAYAWLLCITPLNGNRMMASKLVTINGSALEIQKNTHTAKIASAFCPAGLSPLGVAALATAK